MALNRCSKISTSVSFPERKSASSAKTARENRRTCYASMAGEDEEFQGHAEITSGHSAGIVLQEPLLDDELTVRQTLELAFAEVSEKMAEYNECAAKMAEPLDDDEMQRVMDRYGRVAGRTRRTGRLGPRSDHQCSVGRIVPAGRRPDRGHAFRRRAAARSPGQGVVGETQPAAARRTDQPSRRWKTVSIGWKCSSASIRGR